MDFMEEVMRTVDYFDAKEKVLVFCHYRPLLVLLFAFRVFCRFLLQAAIRGFRARFPCSRRPRWTTKRKKNR